MRMRGLALAGIVAPIWFTALVVLQGFLQPDYSHVRLPISALAVWPTGWIQDVNSYVTGALTMIFAFALHRGVQPTRRGAIGCALFAMGGLGIVLAGIFPGKWWMASLPKPRLTWLVRLWPSRPAGSASL